MKRRSMVTGLAAVIAVSLTACGGAGSSTTASTGATSQETTAGMTASASGKSYDIVYLSPSTASNFWSQVEVGILQAKTDAEKEYGITINYTLTGPAEEQQTEEYITAFENTIALNPNAIVTATLSIDPTVPKAREATQAGIVLNFVNCGIGTGDDGANEDCYNEFYYCSNDTIGEMAGQAFLAAMKAKDIPMEGGVIGVNMNAENEALEHRIQSFRDYISANAPGLEMTETYYNGNNTEKAQTNAENIIASYGDKLIGLYSGNNITADGVCQAVSAANLGKSFVSVGVDSDDIEVSALRSGTLDAIIVQDAYTQGYNCMMNAILTVMNGKNPEEKKQINCPPTIVTSENIDSEEVQFMMNPAIR
ncbi:substrate-binding domain-containing protein [Oribacterium sp. oral taxon 102]|uniref:substrate-binding domain-containing protein n=1 Tax=Oribacterium sp. oral taxon 102 TaxID=671214 RepID=UPI0015C0605F|nr:substrate-binding domain-containing protein [Oribacterium sp. oral taxon 102]NWO21021.1 substrate-binding domain-containing protein [Oribacterium sp. oral taxon 102]